ncbi:3-deoxy-D-manno-octulosonic acid transferase [Lysobacteraceae bacterium NML71-0210]|nr:3-deoxy-D-manno-octulosonic acid transferase [Xanthomonadaceae bacterium NML71-0210]
MVSFSDYIVFVDESGDHSLAKIDESYPVFVLACCLIEKKAYIEQVVPQLQAFKFKHFGHDAVVLHEKEIRRDLGEFSFLKEKSRKEAFINELTGVLASAPFRIFSAVIDKRKLAQRQRDENPYEISLQFCLERMHYALNKEGQVNLATHVLCEGRGKREDEQLKLAFRRICAGDNFNREHFSFEPVIADKKINSTGLQLADLVARPIGLHVLRPEQANRTWDVLKEKFHCDGRGRIQGYGLKTFP